MRHENRFLPTVFILFFAAAPAYGFSVEVDAHDGSIGQHYYAEPFAWGAEYPLSLELVSGSLPPGLRLEGGAVRGVPTSEGTFSFTLRIVDDAGVVRQSSGSIVVHPYIGPTEYRIDFSNSSTGQLNGTFGDVKISATDNIGLKDVATLGGYENSNPQCGGTAGHAAVAILSGMGTKAVLTLTFPAPVHEVEFTAASGRHSNVLVNNNSTVYGVNDYFWVNGCKWNVWDGFREDLYSPVTEVTIELENYQSGQSVVYIDDIVARRLDCPTPSPPMDMALSPSTPVAGEPVYSFWKQPADFEGATFLNVWHDDVRLEVADVGNRTAKIATLPSTGGYDLQLQLMQIAACSSPSGDTVHLLGPPVIRNYRLNPGATMTDNALSIDYVPKVVPWNRSFLVYGSGFLGTLEEVQAEGASDATPVVTASFSYDCGSQSGTRTRMLTLLDASHDQLEVLTPESPCQPSRPVTARFEIKNFRGETVVFESEIMDPLPRTRGIRRH